MWVLFVGRIIDGLSAGNISVMYAYVADVTPPSERGRAYGLLGAVGGVGFMFAPLWAGCWASIPLRRRCSPPPH